MEVLGQAAAYLLPDLDVNSVVSLRKSAVDLQLRDAACLQVDGVGSGILVTVASRVDAGEGAGPGVAVAVGIPTQRHGVAQQWQAPGHDQVRRGPLTKVTDPGAIAARLSPAVPVPSAPTFPIRSR